MKDMTVIRLKLETGRTHQIRVHCKAIGHPILGDGLYSERKTDFMQLCEKSAGRQPGEAAFFGGELEGNLSFAERKVPLERSPC